MLLAQLAHSSLVNPDFAIDCFHLPEFDQVLDSQIVSPKDGVARTDFLNEAQYLGGNREALLGGIGSREHNVPPVEAVDQGVTISGAPADFHGETRKLVASLVFIRRAELFCQARENESALRRMILA